MTRPDQYLIQAKIMDIRSQALLLRSRDAGNPIADAELGSQPAAVNMVSAEFTEIEFHEARANFLETLLGRDTEDLLEQGRKLLTTYAQDLQTMHRVYLSLLGYAVTGRGELEALLVLLEG